MNQQPQETISSLETQIASLQRLIDEIEADTNTTTDPDDGECLKNLKIRLLNELIRRARAKLELLAK